MSVNIKTPEGLMKISGDKVTQSNIVTALGYVPVNETHTHTIANINNLQMTLDTLESHTTNTSNPHNVTASQIGLGNVDNTSDVDKPISTAQQEALDSLELKFNDYYNQGEVDNEIATAYDNVLAEVDTKIQNRTGKVVCFEVGALTSLTVGQVKQIYNSYINGNAVTIIDNGANYTTSVKRIYGSVTYVSCNSNMIELYISSGNSGYNYHVSCYITDDDSTKATWLSDGSHSHDSEYYRKEETYSKTEVEEGYAIKEHTHDDLYASIADIPDYITTGAKSGTTIGTCATAEGYNTTASGYGSHAEGYHTTASANYAHAEGANTTASGVGSHAEGSFANALGNYSHAGGYYTIANEYQYVVGKYNKDTTAPTSLTDTATSAGLFIVGIGSSEDARSNGFRVSAGGKVYGTGVFGTSGADYAEYFEWFDGNPNNEDRRGHFVTLDGGKIRYATSNDDYILGVVSANPSVAGDIQSENWHDMYLKDIYGSKIVEVVEVEETTNENGEIIPAHTESRWVLNPNYNPNVKYTSREERPEWAAIGIVGKLVVVDDGTCQVNGYCYPNVDGIATASQDKTNYRVMERLDDTHIRIFIK